MPAKKARSKAERQGAFAGAAAVVKGHLADIFEAGRGESVGEVLELLIARLAAEQHPPSPPPEPPSP